ncbi:unnamed protein product [Arctogadus glacialis]
MKKLRVLADLHALRTRPLFPDVSTEAVSFSASIAGLEHADEGSGGSEYVDLLELRRRLIPLPDQHPREGREMNPIFPILQRAPPDLNIKWPRVLSASSDTNKEHMTLDRTWDEVTERLVLPLVHVSWLRSIPSH